jgi:hypothetical protein
MVIIEKHIDAINQYRPIKKALINKGLIVKTFFSANRFPYFIFSDFVILRITST